MVMRAESYNTSPRIKYVIDHQKIIIISLEYHPSLRHNIHTHFQDRIQTIYQPGIPGTDEDGIFVKLCVHFCVRVSKSLKKWTQTDTKVTFHPPPTHPPGNFFWSQMKGMAKIRLFYSGDMALILPR